MHWSQAHSIRPGCRRSLHRGERNNSGLKPKAGVNRSGAAGTREHILCIPPGTNDYRGPEYALHATGKRAPSPEIPAFGQTRRVIRALVSGRDDEYRTACRSRILDVIASSSICNQAPCQLPFHESRRLYRQHPQRREARQKLRVRFVAVQVDNHSEDRFGSKPVKLRTTPPVSAGISRIFAR